MTALLLFLACRPAPPPHEIHSDAPTALRSLLTDELRVLGVGEVHTTRSDHESTLARFTRELWPILAPRTTDLVLETWRVHGDCVVTAKAAATAVQEQTHRPAEVSSDLARLAQDAIRRGVRAHDLPITCHEHAGIVTAGGNVDFGHLLAVLTERLRDNALTALNTPDARVVLYTGAVHNDIHPKAGAERYSYGTAAHERGGAAFLELDLLDTTILNEKPQLIEPEWAPLLTLPGPVILYRRSPQSVILLLRP